MTKVSSHQTLCTWDDKFGGFICCTFFSAPKMTDNTVKCREISHCYQVFNLRAKMLQNIHRERERKKEHKKSPNTEKSFNKLIKHKRRKNFQALSKCYEIHRCLLLNFFLLSSLPHTMCCILQEDISFRTLKLE